MTIQEDIRVTGTDKAAQDINRVADATGRAGKETEDAGGKAKGAGRDFDDLGGGLDRVGHAAVGMMGGFAGLEGVRQIAGEILTIFEQIVELQDKLATGSLAALETIMPLAGQRRDYSQAGQEISLADATRLRKEALMPSLEGAQALGTAMDISLPGGFDSVEKPAAFERNLKVGGIVGGALPTGTVKTYGALLEVLAAVPGLLDDSERIKVELARILAVQAASQSSDPASFAAGLAGKGIKGFLAGGGSVTDAAVLLLQARQAVSNDAEAATTAGIILQVARGSTATREFLTGKAREFGLGDFDALSETQLLQVLERTFVQAAEGGPSAMAALLREGFEPGQFALIKGAFAETSRDAAAKARAGVAGVRAAGIDRQWADFANSQVGMARVTEAQEEYDDAKVGMATFYEVQFRRAAERRLARMRAKREIPWLQEVLESDEMLIERLMVDAMLRQVDRVEAAGGDATVAREALFEGSLSKNLSPIWGHFDETLAAGIRKVVDASMAAGVPVQVTNNTTNVANNYADTKPGYGRQDYPHYGD